MKQDSPFYEHLSTLVADEDALLDLAGHAPREPIPNVFFGAAKWMTNDFGGFRHLRSLALPGAVDPPAPVSLGLRQSSTNSSMIVCKQAMNLVGNRAVLQASLVLSALGLAGSWAPSQASPAVEEAPYRILVTNDDGIDSPGLAELVKALRPLGEVTIVAPLKNQSGISHALNLRDPIFVDQRVVAGQSATALTATPVTCVRVAIDQLLKGKRPDLIVSGVNRGLNFGRNTYISGTVAAAREAALQGIPAIAVSLAIEAHPNYAEAAEMAAEVAGIVKANGLPAGVFLNVNVPRPPARPLRLTRQSRLAGAEHFDPRQTPYGRPYFWSYFEQPTAAGEAGSDVEAVRAGFVAVTPLHASESDESAIELLADFFPPTVRAGPTGILGSHPSEP